MGWGLSWLGGLGGWSGKAQLQWGEGRGRLAAALARVPAREALAHILTPSKTNGDALQPPCKLRQKGT